MGPVFSIVNPTDGLRLTNGDWWFVNPFASRLGTAGHSLLVVSVWRYTPFNTNATATTLVSTLLCMGAIVFVKPFDGRVG
jgi:hypothetical protein